MGLPKVAIVGRPNVGKSSILNWLAGRRVAVVDDRAGVTRDRVTCLVELHDSVVEMIDTGGIGLVDAEELQQHVTRQIDIALREADLVLFVADARQGITPLDEEVARRLRSLQRPVICVPNKSDAPSWDFAAQEFCRFGWPTVPVSAEQQRGKSDLIDAICELLPQDQAAESGEIEEPVMKLAIVGRRNVGKSTFINSLAQEERMIVSEIPGTTRDSVDVRFEMDGKVFVAIDTPGLLRRKSVHENVEFYGICRAQESVRRADVVLLFFDASQEIARVDKQLVKYVAEHHKPCVFVVNKWDLIAGKASTEAWADYLYGTFGTMNYVPTAFITAKTGKNVKRLVNLAQSLFKQSRQRVGTGSLNRVLQKILKRNPPPLAGTRRPKVFFAAQVAVQPPTIVLFCNDPEIFSPTYRRYIVNALRDELPYSEIPIRLFLRQREGRAGTAPVLALDERDDEPTDEESLNDAWTDDEF